MQGVHQCAAAAAAAHEDMHRANSRSKAHIKPIGVKWRELSRTAAARAAVTHVRLILHDARDESEGRGKTNLRDCE